MQNFENLFKLAASLRVPLFRYVFNSLLVTVLCTGVQVILASMAAYPLAKHEFRGKKLIFGVIVISLLFAGDVTFLPQYILISSFKLIDTYFAMILPVMASSLGLYLMRQNLLAFPDSVIESARIDGAGESVVFWRIIMPSMKPVWMTMTLFSFVSMWSRSDTSYIYSEQLKSLPTLLNQISAGGIARAGVSAANAVLLMIPPIIVFLMTQSNVLETMANSGMKE